MTVFENLFKVNVNGQVEKKNGLNYLSWVFAWAEVKKRYPEATYEVKQFGENQLPYVYDENTGYMVFTTVTIKGLTHEMWLPVMDSANKAMKNKPYTYDTRYKKGVVVEAATMFDINKTIMRCLAKNLAMFGLGLYIYAGEDLPESEAVNKNAKGQNPQQKTLSDKTTTELNELIMEYSKSFNKSISDISKELTDLVKKPLKTTTESEAKTLLAYLKSKISGGDNE